MVEEEKKEPHIVEDKKGEHIVKETPSEHQAHVPKAAPTHTANKAKKSKKLMGGWQMLSLVLAIALIASIYSGGFTQEECNIDEVITKMGVLSEKAEDTEVRTTLEVIKDELADVRDEIIALEATKAKDPLPQVTDKITIIEYSDFECPFCKRGYDIINEVKEKFGDSVEVQFKHFPLSFHKNAQKASEASECARDQGKFWEMHDMIFENQKAMTIDDLKGYAVELGLDTGRFNTCLDNGDHEAKVKQDMAEGQERGVSGTPAFFIGDKMISGAQPFDKFAQIICQKIPEHSACGDMPEPVDLTITVITDELCTSCDTSRIKSTNSQLFPGVKHVEVDYAEDETQELMEEMDITLLPAYVFPAALTETNAWKTNTRIHNAFEQIGEKYKLVPAAVGATYDPEAEICDNGKDDRDQDGKIDCADDECKETMDCRPEKEGRLDLFVMSQCPFGTKALDAMEEVLENFEDDIEFHVNFIANENADGTFNALHGQPEVDENIRELCAIEHYPDDYQYMDYIWCRNKDIMSTDWGPCAEEAEMDVEVMKECFEGDEGKKLHSDNIKLGNSLGISASPTWLANNNAKFSGVDSETVKSNFCKSNPDLDGCDNTLSSDSTVSGNCG